MSGKREARRRVKMQARTALLGEQHARLDSWSPGAKAAIAGYPALASIFQSKHVLSCAKNLDASPEADWALALDRLTLQDQVVLAALAEVPPMPGRAERLRADEQLASLIDVIERNSTPFNLTAHNAARLARAAEIGETDKPAA